MRQLPRNDFKYCGLTVVLDKLGRFDRSEPLSGISGAYFDSCLLAGGNPAINRSTIEVRTLNSLSEPYLDGTKALLLLGADTIEYFKKDVTLDEQRGSPFVVNGKPCVATYAPQDADDRRDYFSGSDDDGDDSDDSGEVAEGKSTHGATQRKNWRFWMRQDIKKAVRLTTNGLHLREPHYHIWPEADTIIRLLTTTKGRRFYFDIETDRHLQMTCFGFAFDENDIYVVPMLQTFMEPKVYYYDATTTAQLLRALAICLRDNIVVIHNSSFDLFALAYRYGIPIVGRVYDTMLAHNRCYIEVEKSLGHVISLYTDLPYHKNEGVFEPHNYAQFQQLLEYNGKDVYALTQVAPAIDATAKRLGAVESIEQVNRMVLPYLTMTLHGIRLDTEAIRKIADYHERYNTQIKRILNVLCGYDFNPNSWQQVAKRLYEERKIPRPDKDPTAEKTLLQLLLKRDIPEIYCVLKYRGNQKRISKVSIKTKKSEPRYWYGLHPIIGPKEPRITTSWRLGKTITMRLGSSKLLRVWGDNLQNWEKMLRRVIIPDRGKVFLQIDQSGAEALIVAYLCRAGQLRDLFLCNINPHSFLAMHLFRPQFEAELGYSLGEYTAATVKQLSTMPKWKEIAKCCKASDDWPPHRRYYFIAKQGNHSLNYDAKARAFRLNTLQKSEGSVVLTIDDAQQVINTRMKLLPELPVWHNDVINEAKKTNILRNLFGHPRVVTQRIEESMYKELYAFKPQSTVGQITNYAITEFQERIVAGDELLTKAEVDVVQNNHDSMLVQCLPEYHKEVAKEMQKHFNRRLVSPRGEEFFMKSEVQVGENWKEMKVLEL